MFVNFAFLTDTAHIIGLTIVQGMTSMIYLLTAYYFMRKSSRVLKNKQRWNIVLKRTMVACCVIFVISEVYSLVLVFWKKATVYDFCYGFTDILMQSNCALAVAAFVVLTMFTTNRINEQMETDTMLVKNYHQKSKRRQR